MNPDDMHIPRDDAKRPVPERKSLVMLPTDEAIDQLVNQGERTLELNGDLDRLEDFLTSTEGQTKEEAFRELEENGVDVTAFSQRIQAIVRKGYQRQVRLAADLARDANTTAAVGIFGDLGKMGRAELISLFENVRNGIFGTGRQQAALARCRNFQGGTISEIELRSWLEDISNTTESAE